MLEACTTLGWLAARTERITLLTVVRPHPPILIGVTTTRVLVAA